MFAAAHTRRWRLVHSERLVAGWRRKWAIEHGQLTLRELDVGSGAVLSHVLRSARLRNRDNSIHAQHPGQRYLGGSRLVLFGDVPHNRMVNQTALLDRRV